MLKISLKSRAWRNDTCYTLPRHFSSGADQLNSMKFVTPRQYAASNVAQFNINVEAVKEFLQLYQSHEEEEKLLDFGCGTGETTAAIAGSKLGLRVNEVLGVDISEQMISYCNKSYNIPNLRFQHLDSSEAESFARSHSSSFSMITSFHCFHWVEDIPQVLSLFRKVLRTNGRLLLVVPGVETENNPHRRVFEEMREEEEWKEMMSNTK